MVFGLLTPYFAIRLKNSRFVYLCCYEGKALVTVPLMCFQRISFTECGCKVTKWRRLYGAENIVLIHKEIPWTRQFFTSDILPALWKVSKFGVFSGPYFHEFRRTTEIYRVNICIQSDCGKTRTREIALFQHFLRRDL